MGSQPSAVTRLKEEERLALSEEEIFERLVEEPATLNRPIIEREQTAFLCRPLEIIKEKCQNMTGRIIYKGENMSLLAKSMKQQRSWKKRFGKT